MELLKRSNGKSAEESYPFACAAINVVYMLTDIMKLKTSTGNSASLQDAVAMRVKSNGEKHHFSFAKMLEKNEKAFMELFCVLIGMHFRSFYFWTMSGYAQMPRKTCLLVTLPEVYLILAQLYAVSHRVENDPREDIGRSKEFSSKKSHISSGHHGN
eukprot:751993-Hanusia_phi.AAC.2